MKVLIIEDDSDTQEMLLLLLKQWSAEVKAVSSATEALELFNQWNPHVLLSDIGLPNTDGYDLVRKIRDLPPAEGGHIPAIAFTAYAKPEDRIRAISEGFNIFLPKPIEPTDLAAAIYSLIRFAQE